MAFGQDVFLGETEYQQKKSPIISMGDDVKVSVVVPAYNEEKTIKKTLIDYAEFLKGSFDEFELIAVNDGSTDHTLREIINSGCARAISYRKNRGKGYAVKRGILMATGDYIFFTDADCSYAPDNIRRAVLIMEKGLAKGVVGIRENRDREYPLSRRILSGGLKKLLAAVLKIDNSDTQCGFKGFEKKTARFLFSRTRIWDFGFDIEIIYLTQIFRIQLEKLPVTFSHRIESKVRPVLAVWQILRDIFAIKSKGALGGYANKI